MIIVSIVWINRGFIFVSKVFLDFKVCVFFLEVI